MENYFATMFEDVRHERSLIILISLTDEMILKQSGFTNPELNITKILALEKLHRQKSIKEYLALQLLELSLKFDNDYYKKNYKIERKYF